MSYHRVCCCPCPYESVDVTVSGVAACGCQTPVEITDSVRILEVSINGAYTLPYFGLDATHDPAGEHIYAVATPSTGLRWNRYDNLGCSGAPTEIHEDPLAIFVWQSTATCRITHIHIFVAGLNPFVFESDVAHRIGTPVANALVCADWPDDADEFIAAQGGIVTVTR